MQYSTNIRKKDKGWQYIITYKDLSGNWKTKSKQGFKTKQEARLTMDDVLINLKDNITSGVSPNEVTFKQFTDTYVEHMKLHREANTILEIKRVSKTFKSLNDKELSKINNLDIQRVVDSLVKKGLKTRTIKSYISRLKTIFRSAKDEYNLISKMPITNIKCKNTKDETAGKRALENKEAAELLEFLLNYKPNKDYFYICSLALQSGLRLGEILGLDTSDIDFKNDVIKIKRQWKLLDETGGYGFGSLKGSNSYREVPMSANLKNKLQEFLKVSNINSKVINITKKNKRLFEYKNTDSVSICINRLFKLNNFDITVHELRHTFATNLISNNVDFKTTAALLGHDVKETMRTYSHVTDDMRKRAATLIKEIF